MTGTLFPLIGIDCIEATKEFFPPFFVLRNAVYSTPVIWGCKSGHPKKKIPFQWVAEIVAGRAAAIFLSFGKKKLTFSKTEKKFLVGRNEVTWAVFRKQRFLRLT